MSDQMTRSDCHNTDDDYNYTCQYTQIIYYQIIIIVTQHMIARCQPDVTFGLRQITTTDATDDNHYVRYY